VEYLANILFEGFKPCPSWRSLEPVVVAALQDEARAVPFQYVCKNAKSPRLGARATNTIIHFSGL
jgi:hypothetical protein